MRRLVLAPHMDDESLGCGGLLAKYPGECAVAVVTAGDTVRLKEHRQAMDILRVADYECLGYTDGRASEDMPALVTSVDALLLRHRPDEFYLPFPSLHQDHIGTYEAGLRSCRVSMSAEHWVPHSVFVYDIAVYDISLYPSDLRWSVFESLTEDQADLKAAACLAYETEVPSGSHPMNSIKEMARSIGQVRLLEYAEQYALVRQIRR